MHAQLSSSLVESKIDTAVIKNTNHFQAKDSGKHS